MSGDLPSPVSLPVNTADDGASYDEETTTLFRAFSARLMGFLGQRYGEQVAQDAMQEAFLRLHRARRDGRRIEHPKSWVARVAEHFAIDQARRSRFRVPLTDEVVESVDGEEARFETPEETCWQRQRLKRLKQEISRLSDLERTCMRLRAEGKTFQEIGPEVGMDFRRVAELVQSVTKRLARRCR